MLSSIVSAPKNCFGHRAAVEVEARDGIMGGIAHQESVFVGDERMRIADVLQVEDLAKLEAVVKL